MAEETTLAALQETLRQTGSPWTAGVTSVSELSPAEKRRLLGVRLPPGMTVADLERESERNRSLMMSTRGAGAAAAVDWRNVNGANYITPVKHQGNCGSCVAFGTVAALEGRMRVQRGDPNLAVDLSEAQLFYCYGKSDGVNCDSGWMPEPALKFVRDKGLTDEAHFPYTAGDQACSPSAGWEGSLTFIQDYTNLTNNPNAIKEFIANSGPVTACFIVYDDFFHYVGGIYKNIVKSKDPSGHCVSLVGYNDGDGCWIAKNSWGPNWGEARPNSTERGFFRIAYGECGIESWAVYGATAIVETGWLNNKRVVGLWTVNQDRNAWAYLDGVGWRRVAYDNDNIFVDVLTQLATAKSGSRPVNVYQDGGVIKQVYVF